MSIEEMTRRSLKALQVNQEAMPAQTIGDQQTKMALASFAQTGANLNGRTSRILSMTQPFQWQATVAVIDA